MDTFHDKESIEPVILTPKQIKALLQAREKSGNLNPPAQNPVPAPVPLRISQ